MKERILITGGTGFVGSALVRQLVYLGHEVSLLVRDKKLNWRLQDIRRNLHIYPVNMLDPSLKRIVRRVNPTGVFHLAAYGTSPQKNDLDSLIDVNIKGFVHLLDALKGTHPKIIINTGSSSEYGIKAKSMKETDALMPINDYGVSKAAMTLFGQKMSIVDNLPIITFRLFSPYGYYEAKERFIPTVIRHMLYDKPLELSSPTFVRDFVFIEDVVQAYIASMNKKFPKGTVLNIGSGKESSLKYVVTLVQKYTQSTSSVRWNPKRTQKRQIEPTHWQADITQAKKLLGWKPITSLDDGIKKTMIWMKQNERFYRDI